MKPYYQSDSGDVVLYHGDCRAVMAALADGSVDAVVTDPPAGISFMGRSWDADHGGRDQWIKWLTGCMAECHRIMKPGAHALVWSIPRTSHWTGTAIEDAGFECRDVVSHIFGSGFPKSLDVAKAIDSRELTGGSGPKNIRQRDMGDDYRPHELAGTPGYGDGRMSRVADTDRDYRSAAEISLDIARQWRGWGTALKPAAEFWWLARKPLCGTVAANVQQHGTGALNIDGCRVPTSDTLTGSGSACLRFGGQNSRPYQESFEAPGCNQNPLGRWPANCIHDGSDEVLAEFAKAGETISRASPANNKPCGKKGAVLELSQWENWHTSGAHHGDSGTPARFFYCAKASRRERGEGNNHPTVKPLSLLTYLCRLVTPPAGTILDPFAGSGTTLLAARMEGMKAIGIEQDESYCEIIVRRMEGKCRAKAEQTAATSRELSLFD